MEIVERHPERYFSDEEELRGFKVLAKKIQEKPSKKNIYDQINQCLMSGRGERMVMVFRLLVMRVCRQRYAVYAAQKGKSDDFKSYADVKNREVLHLFQQIMSSSGE
jgi:hypothetical protein